VYGVTSSASQAASRAQSNSRDRQLPRAYSAPSGLGKSSRELGGSPESASAALSGTGAALRDHVDELARIAERILEMENRPPRIPELSDGAPEWERAYWEGRRARG